MAFVPLSDLIGAGDQITNTSVVSGDLVLIRPGINVIATTGDAIGITHAFARFQVDGFVFGDDNGLRADTNATSGYDFTAAIGATGSISSRHSAAILMGSYLETTDMTGNRITLTNAGQVTSHNTGAVFLYSAESAFVTNSGVIRTLSVAGFNNAALTFKEVTNVQVINSGLIEATNPHVFTTGAAIYANDETTNMTIVNTGQILSPTLAIASDVSVSDSVTNLGIISGDVQLSDDAASTLVNRGTIHGDVELRGGADRYDGRGSGVITGIVYGGTEDDTILGGDGDETLNGDDQNDRVSGLGGDDALYGGGHKDTLYGGAGEDTLYGGFDTDSIYGGAADDLLYGDTANDTMYGGAGDDTLSGDSNEDLIYGGANEDTINGGGSADTLYGGAGDDTIDGSTNNDFLSGGLGDDSILGDSGNDTLYGGWGADTLTGGTAADVFVFNTAPDGSVDEITDFAVIDDTIWLDDKAFLGLSAGALAATAFVSNTTGLATTAAHRVIYENDTGALFFDADGSGSGARVQFATLTVGLGMTSADFLVV